MRSSRARFSLEESGITSSVSFLGHWAGGLETDKYIDFVESAGQWDSDEIFLESINILQAKVNRLKKHTLRMLQQEEEQAEREAGIEDADAMEE